MRVLMYNVSEMVNAVKWHYGQAEYIDVTNSLDDIPQMQADMVVVGLDGITYSDRETLRNLRLTDKTGRAYAFVDEEDLSDWMADMVDCRIETSRDLAKSVTHQEWLEFELFDITAIGFQLTGRERRDDFGANCLIGQNKNTGKSISVILGYGDYRQYDRLVVEKYLQFDEVYVMIDDFESRRRMVEDLHDCDYIHGEDYIYQLPDSLKHIKELADEKLGMFDPYYW